LIDWRFFAAATVAFASSPALADIPFLTDDPFLIEPGHYEIALGLDLLALPGADPTLAAASVDFGISDTAQVGVAALAMDADRFTVGELAASAKFALIAPREGQFAVAFAPALAIPLNDAIRHRAGVDLPLYGGVTSGEWSIYGGGGYAFHSARDGGSFPFAGVVASRSINERWTLGGEFNGRGSNDHGPGFVEIGAGAAVALGERFTLAAAIYRTLSHRGANGDGRAFLTLRYAR
jgi:hypothetical protein